MLPSRLAITAVIAGLALGLALLPPGFAEAAAPISQPLDPCPPLPKPERTARPVPTPNLPHPPTCQRPLSFTYGIELVGQYGGGIGSLAGHGKFVVFGMGPRLTIFDLTDPYLPRFVGQAPPVYAPIGGIAVSNTLAYVSDGAGALHVFDISSPSNPVEVGVSDASDLSGPMALQGRFAYMVNGNYGLRVVDIGNPAKPIAVGGYDTLGYAVNVAVSGNYAYVADEDNGLQIIDVSKPFKPRLVAGYDPGGIAQHVAVSGHYAYLAADFGGLFVVDVSDPANPVEVGSFDTSGHTIDVSVLGKYAYVNDDENGLVIFNIANPARPFPIGQNASLGGGAIYLPGNGLLYAATDALQIVDISDLTQPVVLSTYRSPNNLTDIAVAGTLAYVVDYYNGLYIFDVSTPANPLPLGSVRGTGGTNRVVVVGNYAYLADWGGLNIVDISDPYHPVTVGIFPMGATDVSVSGSYAYFTTSMQGLYIIDVSNPSQPQLVSTYDPVPSAVGAAVFVSGHYVYMPESSVALYVIDVSNPAQPFTAGTYTGTTIVGDFALKGTTLYMASGGDGAQLADISNPAKPVKLGATDTLYAVGVDAGANYAYVCDWISTLRLYDVSNPARPEEVSLYDMGGYCSKVTASGGYAYVANYREGLYIFRYSGTTLHIASVEPSYAYNGREYRVRGQATIQTGLGTPVAGVTVTLNVTLPGGDIIHAVRPSDASGKVTVAVTTSVTGTYKFCVGSLNKPDYLYDASQNVATCGSVTVR
ncbi:MAG: hypothetical protein HYR71_00930 [Chloroflexi bacterium]|nr:hypothetical protein [Chloroflexota bacterium]